MSMCHHKFLKYMAEARKKASDKASKEAAAAWGKRLEAEVLAKNKYMFHATKAFLGYRDRCKAQVEESMSELKVQALEKQALAEELKPEKR